eukprot:scaffold6660_cov72-Cylindrotheca_fusiformis.AAC.1
MSLTHMSVTGHATAVQWSKKENFKYTKAKVICPRFHATSSKHGTSSPISCKFSQHGFARNLRFHANLRHKDLHVIPDFMQVFVTNICT